MLLAPLLSTLLEVRRKVIVWLSNIVLGSFQHIQPDCYAPQGYDYIADSEKRINDYQCVFSEICHSDYIKNRNDDENNSYYISE